MADYGEVLSETQTRLQPYLESMQVGHWEGISGHYMDQTRHGMIPNAEGWISLDGCVTYPIVDGERSSEPSRSIVFASVSRHELHLDLETMRAESALSPYRKTVFATGANESWFDDARTHASEAELQGIQRASQLCLEWLQAPTLEAKRELRDAAQAKYKK